MVTTADQDPILFPVVSVETDSPSLGYRHQWEDRKCTTLKHDNYHTTQPNFFRPKVTKLQINEYKRTKQSPKQLLHIMSKTLLHYYTS